MSIIWKIFNISAISLAMCQAEVWSNSQGRTFEAELIRTEGTQAHFRLEGGREFYHSIQDLDAKSQAVIRQRSSEPLEDLNSNFGSPWPHMVRADGNPACKVISEDREKSRYVYESPGYRFHCDDRITQDALSNFATVFEATRAYISALPVSMMSRESLGTRSRILLFGDEANYIRSGGPQGSAGCFIPNHRLVLLPMSSLGLVKGGTGYGRDLGRENQILIHELVHQLTPSAYFANGSQGWFSEGLAEYVAITPYHSGTFRPDIQGNAIVDYVSAFGSDGKFGRNLGKTIRSPHLADFMLMDYSGFTGGDSNRNYALGLLLTHYFFHMEGDGKARRITQFLKGLHAGKAGRGALEPLLDAENFGKLEGEISEAWARKGIQISFGD